MPDDTDRAFACMLRGDIAGARTEPFRYGLAVFDDALPLRHDSNYLLVERDVDDAGGLAAEAERLQGGAGLAHRLLLFPRADRAAQIATRLAPLGYVQESFVIMAQHRRPEKDADTSLVVEVDEAALRDAWRREILSEHWGSPDVADQLVAAHARIPLKARFFAVLVDGEVASHADLYLDGESAQVEAVATDEAHRGRGYASAVTLRAVAEARAAGAAFVFLVASADDWPQRLYARLGFDEVGRYAKLTKVLGQGS
jgi:ribosomal protein S18 acetylase RimI-like enzyme